ncbi:MAG: zinc ABC transporter substrate-binding protein [Deltaproteobacteria bacterium]|nr:zinc ABC transporter substrate-binding protein [Deltaproteobacteria bacterium]
MKKPHRNPGLALAAALMTLTAAACAPPAEEPGKPRVVATIFPVADLAAWVGGEAVDVESLLPPRASVHTWEASPGQIRSLSQARAFISVGGGLDTWLEAMGADTPGLTTLRLTDGMTLRRADAPHSHGPEPAHEQDHEQEHGEAEATGDPHVWLDPLLVRDEFVPRIRDLITALAPAQEAAIRERAQALSDSLTALDGEIRAILAGRKLDGFIATHDAWAYFADRYGLVPLGHIYASPGHEPSARGLATLVDAARAAGLGAVLTEPQLSETAAQALAGELGAYVVTVDPLGGAGVEGRGSYLDLMRFNARAFAQALGKP